MARWKGTQYRAFLHYVGIVVLKDYLQRDVYNHFLLLFCAATICSAKRYFKLLPLARDMLNQYIEIFKEIYGEQYVTSNIHNLAHLVDDVERYGVLESFSAYPFENLLGKLKRKIRNGNRPLQQIAKRIVEGIDCTSSAKTDPQWRLNGASSSESLKIVLSKRNDGENIPEHLTSSTEDVMFYSKVEVKDVEYPYSLSIDLANCWFLTKENSIARVMNILFRGQSNVKLCCISTKEKDNFFEIPIASSFLDIYCVHRDVHLDNSGCSKMEIIDFSSIKCKLVRVKYHEKNVFLPLLHTNKMVDDDGESEE